MPIHINLLAEAHAQEEMRRRDPVKRAIFIGVSLVAVALMYGVLMFGRAFLVKGSLANVQQAIDSKTNAYNRAEVDLKKVAAARGRLTALEKLQVARFSQADLLNALQQATVDGVQLTRLQLEQSYFPIQGEAEAGKPPKPSTIREGIVLRLNARDFSANPGDQVNKFKDTIAKNLYLQTLLDKTNAVQLTSPPSIPQTDGGKPYVTFALECRFSDQTR